MKMYAGGIADNSGLIENALSSVAKDIAGSMTIPTGIAMPSIQDGGFSSQSGGRTIIPPTKQTTIQVTMPGMVIREEADIDKWAGKVVEIVDTHLAQG